MSVTAQLNGTLSLTDNLSGSVQLQKLLSLSYTGSVSSLSQSQLIGTSSVPIPLPVSPAQLVYIRNLSLASAASNVTVTWTPTSGATETSIILSPGAAIMFVETDTVNGITALALTASVVATPVEYLILG